MESLTNDQEAFFGQLQEPLLRKELHKKSPSTNTFRVQKNKHKRFHSMSNVDFSNVVNAEIPPGLASAYLPSEYAYSDISYGRQSPLPNSLVDMTQNFSISSPYMVDLQSPSSAQSINGYTGCDYQLDYNDRKQIDDEEDTGSKVCQWGTCALEFPDCDALVAHISDEHIGSGKTTYVCGWSGCSRMQKPFTKRHKIQNHVRIHTGERPFACPQPNCNKKFSRQDGLNTHMKPYVCSIPGCRKAYYHACSLRKHERSHANGTYDPDDNAPYGGTDGGYSGTDAAFAGSGATFTGINATFAGADAAASLRPLQRMQNVQNVQSMQSFQTLANNIDFELSTLPPSLTNTPVNGMSPTFKASILESLTYEGPTDIDNYNSIIFDPYDNSQSYQDIITPQPMSSASVGGFDYGQLTFPENQGGFGQHEIQQNAALQVQDNAALQDALADSLQFAQYQTPAIEASHY